MQSLKCKISRFRVRYQFLIIRLSAIKSMKLRASKGVSASPYKMRKKLIEKEIISTTSVMNSNSASAESMNNALKCLAIDKNKGFSPSARLEQTANSHCLNKRKKKRKCQYIGNSTFTMKYWWLMTNLKAKLEEISKSSS